MDFSLALVDAPSFKRGEETTREEKVRLFALVKNRNDWKLPVHKIITVRDEFDVPRIADAVMFFCGGMCEAEIISKSVRGTRVRFSCTGYYKNIGA